MALTQFRAKLKEYLRNGGYSYKQLAYALGMHPAQLSNKLNEHNYANLTLNEVKQVVKILAEWQALDTTQEALELLALMGMNANSFTDAQWHSPPLNSLRQTTPFPAHPQPALARPLGHRQNLCSLRPALNLLWPTRGQPCRLSLMTPLA